MMMIEVPRDVCVGVPKECLTSPPKRRHVLRTVVNEHNDGPFSLPQEWPEGKLQEGNKGLFGMPHSTATFYADAYCLVVQERRLLLLIGAKLLY